MNSRAAWRAWDGACLRWEAPPGTAVFLDGVRFSPAPAATQALRFPFAPGGQPRLAFSLHDADGVAVSTVWRVEAGASAAPGVDAWQGDAVPLQPLAVAAEPRAALPPVSIVVPVYNSPQSVQACITALLRWTGRGARLLLIDDASTDAAIAPLLRRFAQRAGIRVLRNERNLGYTATCNRGIALAGSDDVVLLNADTQVGPRWLERLRLIAGADASSGTVTAVSDNAGAFSVPELEQACPPPAAWTLTQAQRALLHDCVGCLPQLPTGNGFCMYVKRALFDTVGVLDEQGFGAGYGEENDLCQRAAHAGFRHLIAGDVLVQHARSASFGAQRRAELGERGMAVLRQRYPDYEAQVGASLYAFERLVLDWRVRRAYAMAGLHAAPRPRVLLTGVAQEAVTSHAQLDARFEFVRVADAADIDATLLARESIELVHAVGADPRLRAAAAAARVPLLDRVVAADALAGEYRACWRAHAAFAWDAQAASLD